MVYRLWMCSDPDFYDELSLETLFIFICFDPLILLAFIRLTVDEWAQSEGAPVLDVVTCCVSLWPWPRGNGRISRLYVKCCSLERDVFPVAVGCAL